ncbi:putative reverse transcriptase domain-containing protein [Tanacetum coccineum]
MEIRQFLERNQVSIGEKRRERFPVDKAESCAGPILALPDGSEDFVVYCDASHKGLGAVLMQREKVIAYASRQLKWQARDTCLNLSLVIVMGDSLQISGDSFQKASWVRILAWHAVSSRKLTGQRRWNHSKLSWTCYVALRD